MDKRQENETCQASPEEEKDESSQHIDINHNTTTEEVKEVYHPMSIISAILYLVCSTSVTFLNKSVFTSYGFNYMFFIMTCETILSVVAFEVCRCFQCVRIREVHYSKGLSLCLVSVFFAVYALTSLLAIDGMSIPMFSALKRCTPFVTLILSILVLRTKAPGIGVIIAVISVTAGCILASLGDAQFSVMPYVYGAASVLVRGLYLIFIQKCTADTSPLQIMYVNSWSTLPVFFILFLIFEVDEIVQFKEVGDLGFLMCLLGQVCLGAFLSFSLFFCTAENSALTTSVIGVFKTIIVTVIGCFTFGGIVFNAMNISGLVLNATGGILYVIAKYKTKGDVSSESIITRM